MIVDSVGLALISMLVFIGYRGGALRSLARWVAVIGAMVLSVPLGSAMKGDVAGWLPDYPKLVGPAATLVAGAALLVLFLIVASIVVRFLRGSRLVARSDQLLGVVLGLAKGVLLVYVVLCFLVLLEGPLARAFPAVGRQLKASVGVRLARDVNLVGDFLKPAPRAAPPPTRL